MGFFIAQLLTGLASASSLFLVAAGLSIIFGVTRIVNFAHGSFFMLGAYLAYSIVGLLPLGVLGFWGAVLLAALIVGLIGALIEFALLSRLYRAPPLFQLVATFALVLIIQDVALWIWGAEDLVGPRAPGLDGAVRILGEAIPEYDLALIVIGPLVLFATWLLFYRSRWGVLVRAATEDREMLAALGVNQRWLFTSVFFVGSFLAGLGGALQLPRESVSLLMDLNVIAEAFVVVVIGGMGSVPGAYLAAVLIGELNAFGVLWLPEITLVLPFLVMAAVLIARPWGLLGKPERGGHETLLAERPLSLPGPALKAALLAGLLLLAALPLFAESFTLVLMTDVMIAALFAASLQFMMGLGGMTSFGHAAYFGLGAYGAALLATKAALPMVPALLGGPFLALAGAALFGWFCVRLTGVYLAMLTLAAAQIVWSLVFQWREVTGGDDGILGVWPADWAASREAVYWLTLLIAAGGIALLWRFAHAPFGYLLRAGRDSPQRAGAIGIDVKRQQWFAFIAAGTFAGMAGAIFAFSKGSIFPDELAIPRSVDGLVMVLLGGLHSLFGPLLGAGAFVLLEDWISRLDYWRLILGVVILVIVTAAPDGIAGGLRRLWALLAPRREVRP
jgi:branched-chain amino acid transport system permease protein